ncbi:SNF2 family N-terminal domain-domain-containing protein [Catenaria anguillulae PL171]|uniref:SNF2 family N-terminal domain-domain-containing protein n=1 Tax=Catenaria anguillulae PL171 TaxID=765915 RepID=A0A1Y2H7U1_9FUNG|nr:SNF2 family N-terminal domain-domain-containing protein [Catenaria anguillulae PL171]
MPMANRKELCCLCWPHSAPRVREHAFQAQTPARCSNEPTVVSRRPQISFSTASIILHPLLHNTLHRDRQNGMHRLINHHQNHNQYRRNPAPALCLDDCSLANSPPPHSQCHRESRSLLVTVTTSTSRIPLALRLVKGHERVQPATIQPLPHHPHQLQHPQSSHLFDSHARNPDPHSGESGALKPLGSATIIFAAPALRLGDEIIVSIALHLDTIKVAELNRSSSSSDSAAIWSEIREPLCGMLAALAVVPRRAGMPTPLTSDIWSSLRGLSMSTPDAPSSDEPSTTTESADSPDGDAANPNTQPDHVLLASLFATSQTSIETIPRQPTPKSMVYELRPYQEQALYWMLQKETQTIGGDEEDTLAAAMHPLFFELPLPSSPTASWFVNPFDGAIKLKFPPVDSHARGGILADEMGLGKTIEISALIHANPPPASTSTSSRVYPATLVVCPMSLLSQWSSELVASSQDKSIQVFEYYGPNRTLPSLFSTTSSSTRSRSRSQPNTSDKLTVIVTTYGVVMSEFNNASVGGSRPLFDCEFHRIVLDEAHSIRNTSASTTRACWALRASLRWALTGTPIVNKLDDMYSLLAYLKYAPWSQQTFWRHHVTGPLDAERAAADGMSALKGGKGKAKAGAGVSSAAQEAAAAAAAARAVETVQNLMQQLVLRRTKETKINGESILVLPKKEVAVEVLEFTPEERDIYRALEKHTRTKFSHFVKAGTVLSNYTHILALISSLRQCCNHPSLLFRSATSDPDPLHASEDGQEDFHTLLTRFLDGTASSSSSDSNSFGQSVINSLASGNENMPSRSAGNKDAPAASECPLCLDLVAEPTILKCFHVFCRECLLESLACMTRRGDPQSCPMCRIPVADSDVFSVLKSDACDAEDDPSSSSSAGAAKLKVVPTSARGHHIPSTKLRAILAKIRALPGGTKAVVFSQFRGMLDLIGAALSSHGILYARLDGSQAQAKREVELKSFRTDPQVRCLIASLKACNVGLNLTAANVAILVDPWWNAAVEQQAIDRVHRIGQTKEVKVTRFVVKESVEERMVLIQEHKLALISRVTREGRDGKEQGNAREERVKELRMLFGMDELSVESGR